MWVLYHTLGVLVLALVVLILCRVLRPAPAARHALWLLVLLKLLMPPFVSWPLPTPLRSAVTETTILPKSQPLPTTPREEVAVPPPANRISEEEVRDIQLSLARWHPPAVADTSTPASERPPFPWERLGEVCAAVWLCGTIVVAFVQLRRLLRWRAALLHAAPASPELASQVRELAALVGVRPPRLAVVPGLPSPVIWGGGRAYLLWPEELEEQLSPQGCRLVLIHELAHLARGDHWAGWLVLLAGCVWWWHPLFYLIRRQLLRQAELACDARVIALMPDGRRAYAEALLDVCQRQSQRAAATPLVGIAGRRRDLERRLVMIMRANVPGRLNPRLLAGITLVGLIVLPTWTIGQVNTTKKDKPAVSDADKQLQALENKLEGILKDLAAERKARPQEAKREVQRTNNALTDIVIGSDAGDSKRDKKLQELEAKIQALLKEVQALRGKKSADTTLGVLFADIDVDGTVDLFVTNEAQLKPAEVTLSRTTYKLPAAKAEALGKFLEQHVKAIVMEVKVEGENLVVTTTPEAQRGVGQFIALIEGKSAQGRAIHRGDLRSLDMLPQKR